MSDYNSEHIKSSDLLDRLDGYDVLVALGTNSNLEGKGLPDNNNLASVSTTKRTTGRAEAKLQVSVLYDRCCPCFKCWFQVHSVKLRPDCSPWCQAQTVQSQCTKLDMKVSSVRNQPNFGLSCYLEWLTWKMRLKVILGRKKTKLIAMRIESNNICSIFVYCT